MKNTTTQKCTVKPVLKDNLSDQIKVATIDRLLYGKGTACVMPISGPPMTNMER